MRRLVNSFRRSATVRPRFSVITAAHNVDRYIDDYFRSLTAQTLGFRGNIEIVLVDDGSDDDTAAIAASWASRFPGEIRLVAKDHGGVASARNCGLDHVRGEWITFIDADDFVDKHYFRRVAKFLSRERRDFALLACRTIVFDEATGKRRASHPLDYRFRRGERVVDLLKEPDCFELGVKAAFFDTLTFRRLSIRFDERLGTFSDGRFIGEYLLHLERYAIALLPQARYFYRKRSDQSSLLDSRWEKKNTYDERLRLGSLWLLENFARRHGRAPEFVQTAVLYDLSWNFARGREGLDTDKVLNETEAARYEALLGKTFALLDTQLIERFDEARLPAFDKLAILRRYKGAEPSSPFAIVGPLDHRRHLVRLTWFDDGTGEAMAVVDGEVRQPAFERRRKRTFNRRPFATERIVWVPLSPGEAVGVTVDGRPIALRVGERAAHEWTFEDILLHSSGESSAKPLRRLLVQLARLPPLRYLYRGAWLFMDRPHQANDNAELLYRWVMAKAPEAEKSYFLLRRGAPEWKKLKRDGFRLLAFGGLRHRLACFNADWLISSHAERDIWGLTHAPKYGNPRPPGFAFLQHGVIKDDVSGWLNSAPIDFIATSARREAESLLTGSYYLTAREVSVTGLARHDRLLKTNLEPRLILVMPTWRIGLTMPGQQKGERRRAADFRSSTYYRTWQAIVGDERLCRDVKNGGFQLAFFLHTNMEQYLTEFELAADVLPLSHGEASIHEAFCRCALFVTDYSSAAFEAALLRRPVVYCQFDADRFYREHTSAQGYFEYARDGFGEVCHDPATLGTLIRDYVADGCRMKPEYAARADKFFAFRDEDNCRRNYEAVVERSAVFRSAHNTGQ